MSPCACPALRQQCLWWVHAMSLRIACVKSLRRINLLPNVGHVTWRVSAVGLPTHRRRSARRRRRRSDVASAMRRRVLRVLPPWGRSIMPPNCRRCLLRRAAYVAILRCASSRQQRSRPNRCRRSNCISRRRNYVSVGAGRDSFSSSLAYAFSFVPPTGSLTGLASNASERLQSIIDRVMLQNRYVLKIPIYFLHIFICIFFYPASWKLSCSFFPAHQARKLQISLAHISVFCCRSLRICNSYR